MSCRPWGTLDWALQLTKPRQWEIFGALGTEERSLAAWHWLRDLKQLACTQLLKILDIPSRHTSRAKRLLEDRKAEFIAAGGRSKDIVDSFELLTELHRIIAIAKAFESGTRGSVVLDITSLPKRFFFPILRHLEKSERVKDLLLTYTSPRRYLENDLLSEDATEWLTLPGFPGQPGKPEPLIVSVGFMAESLQSHLATINKHESVKMLLPFPAPLSVLRRTWESVFCLQSKRPPEKFELHRVDATDMASAYERISSLSRGFDTQSAFAPFGPKPISAAICLYASQHSCSVYYPQPRIYHPDYSQGIGEVDGKRAVFAYWVKHNGNRLYHAE